MRRHSVLAPLFAVLIVLAVLGGAAFIDGPADPVGDAEGILAMDYGEYLGDVFGSWSLSWGSVDKDELKAADTLETKKNVYESLATVEQENDNYLTTYENYLEDTQTIARVEGKNAYIRALENGSSEAEAEIKAENAVADYYSTKQINLINKWNTAMVVANESEATINSDDNISDKYLKLSTSDWTYSIGGLHNESVTLANGSTTRSRVINAGSTNISIADLPVEVDDSGYNAGSLQVDPPTDNQDMINFVDFLRWEDVWSLVKTQNSDVQSDMEALSTTVFDSYKSGDIDESDLIDPYLGSRHYSPSGDYETWLLRTMSSAGVAPPDNLSQFGQMTIETSNGTYQGILMSDGVPDSGSFEVGETYQTSNLTGGQWVLDAENERMVDLSGNFTITNATDSEGESQQSVKYREINYTTTSTEDYQALMDELGELQAEIDAREQSALSGGGGGIMEDSPATLALIAVIVVAIAYIIRRTEDKS